MAQQQPRVGRRRSTTREHISDVALGLFADRGFSEVSVDDVAQAAGIARRSARIARGSARIAHRIAR